MMERKIKTQITTPKPSDWRKFKALRLEALQKDPLAFGRTYEEESRLSDKKWQEKLARAFGPNATELMFVATRDDEYIGLIGAWPKKDRNDWWALKTFYVTPKYRRRGVGKLLLRTILTTLDERDEVQKIELRVNMKQTAAIKLYLDFGFTITETLKNDGGGNGVPCDKYVMIRSKKQPPKKLGPA